MSEPPAREPSEVDDDAEGRGGADRLGEAALESSCAEDRRALESELARVFGRIRDEFSGSGPGTVGKAP